LQCIGAQAGMPGKKEWRSLKQAAEKLTFCRSERSPPAGRAGEESLFDLSPTHRQIPQRKTRLGMTRNNR
jgi:hypothetical protein